LKKLIALLQDAGVWSEDYEDILEEIHAKCNECKAYSQTPPRPAVALSMASKLIRKSGGSEQVSQKGEAVFYKREGHDRWLGPKKVVFQDGRIVFVRHGGTFV
jgi:hypothetical protein